MSIMQVAAFVISILAVLAAGISALASQRSAVAAQRAAERDPWKIERDDRNGWWLSNTSRRPAYDVIMSSTATNGGLRLADVPNGERIDAGARRRMHIGIGLTQVIPSVTIRWREAEHGDVLMWTTHL